MPVHLAAYDSNGSVVLLLAGDDTKPLTFPLAALLGSVHTYAVDSDWQLQEVSLPDATITYVRGKSGFLWVSACSDACLDHSARTARLQAVDAVAELLLGPSAAQAMRSEVLRRYLRGVQPVLQYVLTATQQWPLSVLPQPQQLLLPWDEPQPHPHNHQQHQEHQGDTILPSQQQQQQQQPAEALQDACRDAAAAAGSSLCAVLHQGVYLGQAGVTPEWERLPSRQLQALQLLLAAKQQEPQGQLRLLGLRSDCTNDSSSRGSDSRTSWKLLWATCGSGLQVAVLTAVDCSPAVWMSSAAPALAVVGALAAQQLAAAGPGSPETPSSAACATVSTGVLDNWATVETAAAPDHRTITRLAAATVQGVCCSGRAVSQGLQYAGGYGDITAVPVMLGCTVAGCH